MLAQRTNILSQREKDAGGGALQVEFLHWLAIANFVVINWLCHRQRCINALSSNAQKVI
jgi:hypothetical protein